MFFGIRQNEQAGNRTRRWLQLECLCRVDKCCAAFHLRRYVELSDGTSSSEFLLCDGAGQALAARSLSKAIAIVESMHGTAHATQHSCRVTGARWWATFGLSEGLIMTLGDWRSGEILRHFINTCGLTHRIINDLILVRGGESRQSRNDEARPTELPTMSEAAVRALMMEEPDLLVIVYNRRRSHRWHRTEARGPSNCRKTICGDSCNTATMHVQYWSEFGSQDEACRNCKWQG